MLWRIVAGIVGGLMLSAAFEPTAWWWMAPPAVAVLTLAARGLGAWRGALLGVVFGLAAYIPMLGWLAVVVGRDAGIALAVVTALFLGITGAGTAVVTRLRAWPVLVPLTWVLSEAVRNRFPFDGWTWGRLGLSQDASPLLGWAALIGVPGLTFVTALVGSLLAFLTLGLWHRLGPEGRAAGRRTAVGAGSGAVPGSGIGSVDGAEVVVRDAVDASDPEVAATAGGVDPDTSGARSRLFLAPAEVDSAPASSVVAGLAMAAVVLAGTVIPLPTQGEDRGGPAQVSVGVVQGNVPRAGLDFNAQRQAVLNNHVSETFRLAEDVAAGRLPQPDVVVWPENASDIDPFTEPAARAAIDAAARAVGVPLLVGAVVEHPQDPDLLLNQGIVWDPVTGPGDAYTKRYLVPFGEYIPWRDFLQQRISRLERIPRDFVAGTEPGGLDLGPTRVGDAICFDVAYDRAMREATRDGGRMLVVQTNNATYNGTDQPAQQLAISRIRAVEHGRSVVVVSTSGLSAVIAPDGTVVAGTELGELEAGHYVVSVSQRDSVTWSDRWGSLPEWLAVVLALVSWLSGVRRARR